MTSSRLLRLVWVLVLWGAVPATAWAGPNTKVFPLAASKMMPSELAGTPEKLTNAVAAMVGAKVSDQSINGAALAAGCTLDDSTCLDRIARQHRVKEIVFGTIRVGDDLRVFVKLTRFIAGTERRERTFVLTSETPSALAKQLTRSAREMFELRPLAEEEEEPRAKEEPQEEPRPRKKERAKEEAEEEEEPRPRKKERVKEAEEPVKTPARAGVGEVEVAEASEASDVSDVSDLESVVRAGAPDDPPVRRGRVSRGTYLLISGGVMTLAVGTGFGIAAYSLRDDARNAKKNTPDDFQRLAAIERAGRMRSTTSAVLLVAGGLAVGGGVVRAILQRRPIDNDRGVAVVPVQGGAALVFSGTLP